MRTSLVRVGIAVGATALAASMLTGVISMTQAGASGESGLTASAPGITKTTIKIGIVSDLTGSNASTFGTTADAMVARFKEINAAGGVDGRQITWAIADTGSTPTGAETAVKDLVENQGVFAIAELSSSFSPAAPYLQQAGIPVTGIPLDGPEWFEQPNTNMFSTLGNGTPTGGPVYSDGGFYKALGSKKISYVEANASAAITEGNGVYLSIKRDGLQACDKTIVPIGGVNFTAFALSFKADGCDTAVSANVLSSSLAMATALHQAGLTKTKIVFEAGPSQQIFQNAQDEAAANGAYFLGGELSSATYSNAASIAFLKGLKKYDPSYTGGLPDLGQADGWPVANLMVEGLMVAGKNPTRHSFITNLRKVTNWTDSGLSAGPINFVHFGQDPPQQCFTYVQFVNNKYVPFPKSGKAFCGTIIPGSGS
ncbi:MAG TPA: ABC transporter substrate-binding protein [Acidimicrobiales bacterium]|nr:ABC transporter substrate-binding protein [Acidimicrobiales bacterium]